MKCVVKIDNLRIFGRHGVFDFETEKGNIFDVSVEIEYDFTAAAESDDFSLALDYSELTAIVKEVMGRPHKLIEAVAWDIRNKIMQRWPEALGGRISVKKLNPPILPPTPDASVSIEW